jgi:hypothetical protein
MQFVRARNSLHPELKEFVTDDDDVRKFQKKLVRNLPWISSRSAFKISKWPSLSFKCELVPGVNGRPAVGHALQQGDKRDQGESQVLAANFNWPRGQLWYVRQGWRLH